MNPVKAATIDKRDQRRQDDRQRQPWPLRDIHKFDRGLRPGDRGQRRKR